MWTPRSFYEGVDRRGGHLAQYGLRALPEPSLLLFPLGARALDSLRVCGYNLP